MSGYSAMNTGIRGLSAAQRAMDVISQNITNANTPGYSRQKINLSSMGVPVAAALQAGYSTVFGGVNVDNVTRIRDAFLEASRVAAGSKYEAINAQHSVMTGVEGLLAEPGDDGLQAVMNDFFGAWHDLANRPGDTGIGAVVLQRGTAVADQLRFLNEGMSARWTVARENLVQTINDANSTAHDLADLNRIIHEGSAAEQQPNELLDKRNMLIRQLGELIGAQAVPGPDGTVGVQVNGVTLVAGTHVEEFKLEGSISLDNADTDPLRITWGGGLPVPVNSGKAAGLMSATVTGLPNMAAQLDDLAMSLKDAVNTVHTGGFTLSGAAGSPFFAGTGAANLTMALSSSADLAVANAAGTVDGTNAMKIGDLLDDPNATAVLGGPGPMERWRGLVSGLGVQTQSLGRSLEIQDTVMATADAAVESDSGVNLDEEMSSMLLYQRAFQASARIITTTDEMLDTLINRTGTVGR